MLSKKYYVSFLLIYCCFNCNRYDSVGFHQRKNTMTSTTDNQRKIQLYLQSIMEKYENKNKSKN